MLGVGIYNIISIRSYEDFARGTYITGGVLFVIVGVAKVILSVIGIVGWGTGLKILLSLVRVYDIGLYYMYIIITCIIQRFKLEIKYSFTVAATIEFLNFTDNAPPLNKCYSIL